RLARALRARGLGVEVYPEPKKLGQQLKYADRRGFRVAVILGSQEFAAGTCQVKLLESGTTIDVALGAPEPAAGGWDVQQAADRLAEKLAEHLGPPPR